MSRWLTFAVLAASLAWNGAALAQATTGEPAGVSFYKQIRPILQEHCQGCHQPAKAGGGVVLTDFPSLLKAGESGAMTVVAGDPEHSELLSQITTTDGTPPSMPKDAPALSAEDVDLVRQWISQGAQDDSPANAVALVDKEHPPIYHNPPVITSVSYSPDGTLLAVSGYHEVLLLAADGSGVKYRLVGLSERIESAVFSPDGKLLAVTGGSPCRFGELQIWTVETGELLSSLTVTYDTIYGASWSPDGTKIAFGCSDNTVRAIDAATGKQVLFQGAHNDWVLDTIFSTDASHLISVGRDRTAKLTEVATQRFVDNITSITPGALKGGLMAVDRHPSQDHILVGGDDGTPKIYKIYREQARQIGDDFNLIRAFGALPGRLFGVSFSRDGSRIVAGSSFEQTGQIRVFAVEDGKEISQVANLGPIFSVAFSPDGKQVVSGGFEGMVRIHDADTGALIREFVPVEITPALAQGGQ